MGSWLTKHFNFLSPKGEGLGDMDAVVSKLQERVAFKQMALFIATSYVANAISKCEVKVYEGGKESRGELYYRLNVSPNPNQSGSQMVNMLVDRLCNEGEALLIPHRSNQLWVADSFSPDKRPMRETVFRSVVVDGFAVGKDFKASAAYHFKLNDANVRGVIDSLHADYGALIGAAMDGFRATRGRKYKLVIESSKSGDKSFNEEYENVVKKQLEAFMDNPNAIYPQFRGYDLQEMRHETSGSTDDIVAMRKEIFDTTAQAFKIPNSMMYGNMTNAADVVTQFLTFAVDPIAVMMGDELTRKSFTRAEWEQGCYVQVDTKKINHTDLFAVADKVEKLISCGAFSIDETRAELGYQPLGTDFSTAHYITKNYSLAEQALEQLGDGEGGDNE